MSNQPDPEAQAQRIKEALFAGNKIEAIKLYRQQTNVGLAEAKAAVEKLEVELRASSPESFQQRQPGKGCLALVLATVGIAVVLSWW